MPVFVSMLRGVNVGAHNRIKMDKLRSLYESLNLEDPRTYVQSGNVIFRTKEKNIAKLTKKIEGGIGKTFGFSPAVVLRTTEEMRATLRANPFAKRKDIVPGKLLVTFLAAEPAAEASEALLEFKSLPEELQLRGRELFIYFPNGAGRSKLPWSQVDKLLKVTGTARNWNSVTKMIAMAEQLESE
jgi:uncharacterized protein (DUF1697 family)